MAAEPSPAIGSESPAADAAVTPTATVAPPARKRKATKVPKKGSRTTKVSKTKNKTLVVSAANKNAQGTGVNTPTGQLATRNAGNKPSTGPSTPATQARRNQLGTARIEKQHAASAAKAKKLSNPSGPSLERSTPPSAVLPFSVARLDASGEHTSVQDQEIIATHKATRDYITALQNEFVHRWDEYNVTALRTEEKEARREEREMRAADALQQWQTEMLQAMRSNDLLPDENNIREDSISSTQQNADAAKDYVMLKTCLHFLNSAKGSDIFSAGSDSSDDDMQIVVEAAQFVLGPSATGEEVNDFFTCSSDIAPFKKEVPPPF